jgi:hypothetical protein
MLAYNYYSTASARYRRLRQWQLWADSESRHQIRLRRAFRGGLTGRLDAPTRCQRGELLDVVPGS